MEGCKTKKQATKHCAICKRKRSCFPLSVAIRATDLVYCCEPCARKELGDDYVERIIVLGIVRWKSKKIVDQLNLETGTEL